MVRVDFRQFYDILPVDLISLKDTVQVYWKQSKNIAHVDLSPLTAKSPVN